MGMDMLGNNPVSKTGKYFRNNVWFWHPLADYIETIAPDIAKTCADWHSNAVDGLNAEDSVALADRLQAEIDSGRTASYAKRYVSYQERLANVTCTVCAGTGIRLSVPTTEAGDPDNGGFMCNRCHGTGYMRPFETYYPYEIENVQEFVAFLRDCGGFRIH